MAKKRSGSLEFEAIKNKYIDDEDGEATIIFRVSMKHKLGAFATPVKKRLLLTIKVL
uniref:Uncharacterized protein n=1 Tax=viral metagenome TaxID=1070528 RepID=A0A6H1ZW24_9ZZZZ